MATEVRAKRHDGMQFGHTQTQTSEPASRILRTTMLQHLIERGNEEARAGTKIAEDTMYSCTSFTYKVTDNVLKAMRSSAILARDRAPAHTHAQKAELGDDKEASDWSGERLAPTAPSA